MTSPTPIKRSKTARISQGDIFRNVEFIEYVIEKGGTVEVSKIVFPLVIVLSQDCDLDLDYRYRWGREPKSNQDKYLFSILVAPLYNAEHVFSGDHLSFLGLKMQDINGSGKTKKSLLKKNEVPRYHYIEFPDVVQIVPSIIDFKHYFTVNGEFLKKSKKHKFVCKVSELYREDISLRFTGFLSRIGLPDAG